MATKLILTIDDGLSRQEMDDLKYLFADALGEFAAKRADPSQYFDNRYPGRDFLGNRDEKIAQVTRRVLLARKLHDPGLRAEFEHIMPHRPTPVYEYYKTCDEDDLGAMSALLDFLPASMFGERKGWMVYRANYVLVVEGPDEQRAFWNTVGEKWSWLEEGQAVAGSVA